MMLHRHFENEKNQATTTLADMNTQQEFVSDVFPPDEPPVEAPKRRGRPRKNND